MKTPVQGGREGGIDRRWLSLALIAGALASPARSAAQMFDLGRDGTLTPEGPRPAYVPPRDLTTVADVYKRMATPVMVNGAGPYPFVVDTGANQSVIGAELAAELGLIVGEQQPLNSVVGVSNTPTTSAALQFGHGAARPAHLSVLPRSSLGGVGLLGLDQLGDSQVTLDFQRQMVHIGARSGDSGSVALPARRRSGQLTLVDVRVAGVIVTAFLDSGAQDTIGNLALRDLAVRRNPTTMFSQVPVVSVTGQSILCDFADLPSLKIGTFDLPNWPIAFADLHVFRMWDLIDRPAMLIGVDLLSRFASVSLDFRRGEVRFEAPTPT